MMTDERQGEGLWAAIGRLPPRSGIVVRHYSLTPTERRTLFERIRSLARRGGHMLLLGGDAVTARRWGADGWHGRGRGIGFHSAPVHDARELRAAERSGAALLFVSPVYPTRSHPGAPSLGEAGFARLARRASVPVVALGGVNAANAGRLRLLGAYGWAGIDAWSA